MFHVSTRKHARGAQRWRPTKNENACQILAGKSFVFALLPQCLNERSRVVVQGLDIQSKASKDGMHEEKKRLHRITIS